MTIISDLVMGSVGVLSRLYLRFGVNLRVRNLPTLIKLIKDRPANVPLITASNHTSTIDDPLMFGVLPPSITSSSRRMRWALGAEEIVFTNALYRWFFFAGRVMPLRRGDGILQPSMNRALELLDTGEWIHMFPEGRVVPDSSGLYGRLKWGVGRLLLETKVPPIFLPIVHQGMEEILPVGTFIPRLGKKLLITIGDPIDTINLRRDLLNDSTLRAIDRRSLATKFIADELAKLYDPNWEHFSKGTRS